MTVRRLVESPYGADVGGRGSQMGLGWERT